MKQWRMIDGDAIYTPCFFRCHLRLHCDFLVSRFVTLLSLSVELKMKALYWMILLYCASVNSDKYEVNLYKHLMNYDLYESAVRPTPSHRLATNATFGFLLHQVINVDEKNQQLTTSSWMNVNWMDQRLSWNHSQWGGVKILHIPSQKVWKPDIILTNNADHEYKESTVSTDVFVTPEGNVTWLFFAIYQSACQIRVRFYPFDDQECSLTFASWSYDGNNVNLKLLTEEGDLSNYVNNSEWAILSMTAHRKVLNFAVGTAPWPVITITIKLGRRPLFYVFNHIIPCVLISVMSMLGFYVPAETGEKVTMCITTLLSMGVFLKTITESMPPSSEAVPLIGMYYVVSLFIVCAATSVNVITLNIHNQGSKNTPRPVPTWARKYILGYMAKWICISVYPSDAQMVHLAERRRKLQNDEGLLNEIATSRNYAEIFGTPVVVTKKECKSNHQINSNQSCKKSNSQQLSPSTHKLSQPSNDAYHKRYQRSQSQSNCRPSIKQNEGPFFADHQSISRQRTNSIFDYDYEIKSLRKLSSQARLISGAISLMQAPLETSNEFLDEIPSTKFKFDSLIGKNRLSTSGSVGARLSMDLPTSTIGKFTQNEKMRNAKASASAKKESHLIKNELDENFYKILRQFYKALRQNEVRTSLQEERTRIMWEWKQVAVVVDRLLLLLFILATFFTTFLILFERALFDDPLPSQQQDTAPPPVI